MTQPASSPFLSKLRVRQVPYSNMLSGYTDVTAGDTTVLYVGDVQTLLGERAQVPSTGMPPVASQRRMAIGTRLVLYAVSTVGAGLELRVNYANNNMTMGATWYQVAIYPLIAGMPISAELDVTSAYVRVDLGCFINGRAHWSIALRGPQ